MLFTPRFDRAKAPGSPAHEATLPKLLLSLPPCARKPHICTVSLPLARGSLRTEEMDIAKKLSILADAAKYDASCASSGAPDRASTGEAGIGSTSRMGICHSYAPDGRCISLLKILLTNFCLYDCQYCVNRRSSDIPRARFAVEEVVQLTLDFYRRNYIEGLFLSSGIIRSPDYTMEEADARRAYAARSARFPRLHPSEDDPRR